MAQLRSSNPVEEERTQAFPPALILINEQHVNTNDPISISRSLKAAEALRPCSADSSVVNSIFTVRTYWRIHTQRDKVVRSDELPYNPNLLLDLLALTGRDNTANVNRRTRRHEAL